MIATHIGRHQKSSELIQATPFYGLLTGLLSLSRVGWPCREKNVRSRIENTRFFGNLSIPDGPVAGLTHSLEPFAHWKIMGAHQEVIYLREVEHAGN